MAFPLENVLKSELREGRLVSPDSVLCDLTVCIDVDAGFNAFFSLI